MSDALTVRLRCPSCDEPVAMTPAEAREIAAGLLAAADNLEVSVLDDGRPKGQG